MKAKFIIYSNVLGSVRSTLYLLAHLILGITLVNIYPHFAEEEMRLREMKLLDPNHPGTRCRGRDVKPSLLGTNTHAARWLGVLLSYLTVFRHLWLCHDRL